MFENPRRGRQARNFTTNVPKILDLKSSSEQIFSRKLPLGAPDVPNHCSQKVLQFIAVCGVHSSLSAWISSVHMDKELAWLRFRKVYVLTESFSKTFLQITDINFRPSIT